MSRTLRQNNSPMYCSKGMSHLHGMGRGLAWFMLLCLCGCRIPGLCFPDPGPVMPDTYSGATTPDNSADVGIIEFFDDPVLTRLIVQGLVNNLELKIRNQDIWIASNQVQASRGAYLPFLGGMLRGGFDRNSRYTPLGAAEDQLTAPGGIRFPDPLRDLLLSTLLCLQIDILRQFLNARDAAANL